MFPRLCAAKAQKGRGALTSPPERMEPLALRRGGRLCPPAMHRTLKTCHCHTSPQTGAAIRNTPRPAPPDHVPVGVGVPDAPFHRTP